MTSVKALFESPTILHRRWGIAWLGVAIALALHVTDEALTGFLPLYDSIVLELRESYAFVPLPAFTFSGWLSGLIVAVLILLLLSPLVFAGRKPLRYLSYVLSVIMILNGLGHIGASLYWGILAPGVISSPILLAAAVALLVTTIDARAQAD
ncbi:MAG: hypothetical protein ACE5FV_00745 [Woeseia sp.]